MPKDATNPRPKWKVSAPILFAMFLLIAMGSAALSWLGREDPNEPAISQQDWGNRVERRLEAIIDRNKPEWAKRVKGQLDPIADTVGFK
jgi:hypothetical protein